MNAKQFYQHCEAHDACKGGLAWIKGKSMEKFWNTSDRGDWMIWLICNSENNVTDKQLRLIAVECARQVQHLMTDQRSITALDVAERYVNGEATDEELAAAGAAARDAAGDAAWAAARAAARAAASDAARDAAWAAAWDAAWDAAWAAAGAKQAEIVRKHVPMLMIND